MHYASARAIPTGLLRVKMENEKFVLIDSVTCKEEKQSELKTVFKNGQLVKEFTLNEIRKRLNEDREIHRAEEKVAKTRMILLIRWFMTIK